MPTRHLDLVSHWRIAAPADAVWAALADTEGWARWWPCVRSVRTLRPGRADGLRSLRRIEWAAGLLGRAVTTVEALEALRPDHLRHRWSGALDGDGVWVLRAGAGITDVTALLRVEFVWRWTGWPALLRAPLVRSRHARVMRSGAVGLASHLAGGTPHAARSGAGR